MQNSVVITFKTIFKLFLKRIINNKNEMIHLMFIFYKKYLTDIISLDILVKRYYIFISKYTILICACIFKYFFRRDSNILLEMSSVCLLKNYYQVSWNVLSLET